MRVEYRLTMVSSVDGDRLNPTSITSIVTVRVEEILTQGIEHVDKSIRFNHSISIKIMPTEEIPPRIQKINGRHEVGYIQGLLRLETSREPRKKGQSKTRIRYLSDR